MKIGQGEINNIGKSNVNQFKSSIIVLLSIRTKS